MTNTERNAVIERCAIIAETLHGVEEGDIPQYVCAGHRIAAEIRTLKRAAPIPPADGGKP